MILAVSDIVWTALIGGVVTIIGGVVTLLLAWMNQRLRRIARTAEQTVVKVEEIHKLTNGGMGDQLQIGMVAAATLAELSPKPEYVALAETARKKYEAHMQTISETSAATKAAVDFAHNLPHS